MRSDSPNAGKEDLRCTVYSCEKQNRKDTQQITQILCNKLAGQIGDTRGSTTNSYETGLPLVTIPSIIFMPVLFLIISQYVGLFLFVISYTVSSCYQQIKCAQKQDLLVAPPPAPLAHYTPPSFSFSTADAEPHFCRVTVGLGYEASGELALELRSRSDQISHIVRLVLNTKKYADIATLEKKIDLAEEIKKHINVVLVSGKVSDVYFIEFITD
jgi:flagellar FliL protein